MSTYRLSYYKPGSGKWYGEGKAELADEFYEAVKEARQLWMDRKLPGLMEGHSNFAVVLTDWSGLSGIVSWGDRE